MTSPFLDELRAERDRLWKVYYDAYAASDAASDAAAVAYADAHYADARYAAARRAMK